MNIPNALQRQVDTVNRHDPQGFAAVYSQGATVVDPQYPEPLRGTTAIAKDMAEFITAFPDLEFNVERVIGNDEIFASEITMRGTHQGPLLGPAGLIPATGKRIELAASVHARVDAEGRVTDERRYFDLASLFAQLGVLQ